MDRPKWTALLFSHNHTANIREPHVPTRSLKNEVLAFVAGCLVWGLGSKIFKRKYLKVTAHPAHAAEMGEGWGARRGCICPIRKSRNHPRRERVPSISVQSRALIRSGPSSSTRGFKCKPHFERSLLSTEQARPNPIVAIAKNELPRGLCVVGCGSWVVGCGL